MKATAALQSEVPEAEPVRETPRSMTVTPIEGPPRPSIEAPPPAVEPSLAIDMPALQKHVTAMARLVGQPSRVLAERLGAAATIGDGVIEWNVADVGVTAGATYGYANVERGIVTGVVFRGRASLDALLALQLPRGIQLTRAGGERPSFSITAGE